MCRGCSITDQKFCSDVCSWWFQVNQTYHQKQLPDSSVKLPIGKSNRDDQN